MKKTTVEERLSITETLYRRNKALNEELKQLKIESDIRMSEIHEKYEEIKKLHAATISELKRENSVHPFLEAEAIIKPTHDQDALRWRISAPKIDWNDKTDSGMLRIRVINGETGADEVVSTCFSNQALLLHQSYIMDMLIEDISNTVSTELKYYLQNKIKQGLDDE